MKELIIWLILLTTLSCSTTKVVSPSVKIHPYGNDSLLIDIRDIDLNSDKTITLYVLDASLDDRVDLLEAELKTRDAATNYRIIGIGHSQYSGEKRRRDFAPPDDTLFFGVDAGSCGSADLFLQFIRDSIRVNYDRDTDKRILVGHSFGGLFGVYCSTLTDSPFDEIYALSPSLWVNYRSFAKHYAVTDSLHIKVPLHISYGSLEQINLVGPSVTDFFENLKDDDKPMVSMFSVQGKTHVSMIKEINNLGF